MKIVAGIDIGNATTETALGRLDGGKLEFLASGTVPTTGIKGTRQNINGIFHSLTDALEKAGLEVKDLSEVRLNEAAPVIGDVAMETITETIITESTMIGHNPSTPGGMGVGVGETVLIGELEDAPGGKGQPEAGRTPVGVEVVGLHPVKLRQVRRRGDLHPLGPGEHDVDVQIVPVGLKEALLRRHSLIGKAGGVHVAPLDLLPLIAHAGEKLVVDPLQGHVQVGVDAPIGQRVGVLGIDHNSNSSQG